MTKTEEAINLAGVSSTGRTITLSGLLGTDDAPPPPRVTLFGADTPSLSMTRTPHCRYTRRYGGSGLTAAFIADILKTQALAPDLLVHPSFKGPVNPTAIRSLMDQLKRPIVLEGFHEFNRAVKNGGPTPEAYRADFQLIHDTVRAHPNSRLVSLCQTVMRWAAVHLADRDWELFAMPELADFVGVDVEWDADAVPADKGYPVADDLFAKAFEIQAKFGKPMLIPEWAWPQLVDDPQGYGLAAMNLDVARICADSGVVAAVAAYDTTGQTSPTGTYALGPRPLAAWNRVLAGTA